jgi:hypothetical protein
MTPCALASTFDEPFPTAIATPASSTVATEGAVDVQMNDTPETADPDSSLAVAEN